MTKSEPMNAVVVIQKTRMEPPTLRCWIKVLKGLVVSGKEVTLSYKNTSVTCLLKLVDDQQWKELDSASPECLCRMDLFITDPSQYDNGGLFYAAIKGESQPEIQVSSS